MTYYTVNQANLVVTITGIKDYFAPFSATYNVNELYAVQNVALIETRLISDNSLLYTITETDSVTINGISYVGSSTATIISALNTVYAYIPPDGDDIDNWVWVNDINSLPAPVGNVITLLNNYTYFFVKLIDLVGNRLVCGQNTTLLGASSENCLIKSTGLTDPLISSNYSIPMRNLTIEAVVALNLDASLYPNQAIDWFGVNFSNCASVGLIKSYSNVIWTDCAILNSGNLTFDGTIGTTGFNSSIFDGSAGQTTFIFPSTLTITRRIRFTNCPFVALAGETALNVSALATIPIEAYRIDKCDFSGGGTYLVGLDYTSNTALFTSNKGIINSSEVSQYTMINNITPTIILAANTYYKIAGATVSQPITSKFTNTDNRATYIGAITRAFKVDSIASLSSNNNNQVGIIVAKNGVVISSSESMTTTSGVGRSENIKAQAVVELAQNDYIEMFTINKTGANNIVDVDLSVIIEALN